MDFRLCDCSGATPPGCTCRKGGGWQCTDAGADARDSEANCDGPSPFACIQQLTLTTSTVTVCSDYSIRPTCADGLWTCPPGQIDDRLCDCSGLVPHGCMCVKGNGWQCPDAGIDASTDI
jgi:hypothetical protein